MISLGTSSRSCSLSLSRSAQALGEISSFGGGGFCRLWPALRCRASAPAVFASAGPAGGATSSDAAFASVTGAAGVVLSIRAARDRSLSFGCPGCFHWLAKSSGSPHASLAGFDEYYFEFSANFCGCRNCSVMRSADGTNLICQAPSLRAPSCEPYFRKGRSQVRLRVDRSGLLSRRNKNQVFLAQFCQNFSARETAVRARRCKKPCFASTYRSHQRTARNAAQNSQQPEDRQQASTPSTRAPAPSRSSTRRTPPARSK